MNSLPDQQSIIIERLKTLECAINEVLISIDDGETHPIFSFIERNLVVFDVPLQPKEIFMEAYEAAAETIESGQEIDNIPGWLRTNCFKIIREHADIRRNDRPATLSNRECSAQKNTSESKEKCAATVKHLLHAIQQLNSVDQKILLLRNYGLTRKQISIYLGMTEKDIQKRERQAITKLRNEYPRKF